jgi:hypothetical protein
MHARTIVCSVGEGMFSPFAHVRVQLLMAWLRSHRLRATLAAVPVLFAHAFVRCLVEKTCRIGSMYVPLCVYAYLCYLLGLLSECVFLAALFMLDDAAVFTIARRRRPTMSSLPINASLAGLLTCGDTTTRRHARLQRALKVGACCMQWYAYFAC